MVLVAVSKDNTFYPVGIGFKIRYIRNDYINSVHLLVRKTKTAVNNNNIGAAFKGGHVFSYFTETTERDYFYFWCHKCLHSSFLRFRKLKTKRTSLKTALFRSLKRGNPPTHIRYVKKFTHSCRRHLPTVLL